MTIEYGAGFCRHTGHGFNKSWYGAHLMRIRIFMLLLVSSFFFLLLCGAGHAQSFRMVSVSPKNGAKDVSVDTQIVIRFNYSVNTYSVPRNILYEATTANEMPVDLFFSDGDEKLTIIPRGQLRPGTQYFVKIVGVQATSSALMDVTTPIILFTTAGGNFMVVPFVSPAEVTLPPGGFADATYSFIESGGGIAEVLQIQLIYEDSNGRQISKSAEEVKFLIRSSQTTRHRATVSVPKEVGSFALGQSIMVRRIFIGVDAVGNRIELKTGTKVNVATLDTPALRISEVAVRVPEFGMMIPKDSIIAAEARIKGAGSGDIHGSWSLDGKPLTFFVAKMNNSGTVNVQAADRAFATGEGKHTLSLALISPEKKNSEEIIYLVTTAPSPIPVLLRPAADAVFSSLSGTPPVFRWSQNPSALSYKIALGRNRTFKADEWVKTETNLWTPDWAKWSALGAGTFYWSVRPVLYNNQEGPVSEPSSFTIKAGQ
jgi:hypothetical protein